MKIELKKLLFPIVPKIEILKYKFCKKGIGTVCWKLQKMITQILKTLISGEAYHIQELEDSLLPS